MKTRGLLILGALAAASVLLLTSKRTKKLRNELVSDADKWKDKLNDFADSTSSKLNDLKEVIGKEVEWLTKNTRKGILSILHEGDKTTKSITNNAKELTH